MRGVDPDMVLSVDEFSLISGRINYLLNTVEPETIPRNNLAVAMALLHDESDRLVLCQERLENCIIRLRGVVVEPCPLADTRR